MPILTHIDGAISYIANKTGQETEEGEGDSGYSQLWRTSESVSYIISHFTELRFSSPSSSQEENTEKLSKFIDTLNGKDRTRSLLA